MADTLIVLEPGTTAIVGYGSLLSLESVRRSFDDGYEGPFVLGSIDGWRRDWSVSMPNAAFYYQEGGERVYPERIHYLNVVQDAGVAINCSIFVVDQPRLATVNGREWIYEAVDVSANLRGVVVMGGPVLMYVGRPEHVRPLASSPRVSAVRRSYVGIVDAALRSLASELQVTFRRSTAVPPAELIIDDALDLQRPSPWAPARSDYRPERQLDSLP
jgi:hypothetical protein